MVKTDIHVIFNEMNLQITLHFKVVELKYYDMIIGYTAIQQHPLLLRTMFLPEQLQAALNPVVKHGLAVECRPPSFSHDDDGFAASSGLGQPAAATHSSAPNEQPKRDNFDYGKRGRSGRTRQM
jgi:hypothetical protein